MSEDMDQWRQRRHITRLTHINLACSEVSNVFLGKSLALLRRLL